MRRFFSQALGVCVVVAALFSVGCSSGSEAEVPEATGETSGLGSLDKNAIYAMGLNFAQELQRIGYGSEQVDVVAQALRDSAKNGFVRIPDKPEDVNTPEQLEAYSTGLTFANTAIRLEPSVEETDLMITAIKEGLAGNPQIELESYRWMIPRLATRRAAEGEKRRVQASLDYLKEAAAKPGAVVTASGMIYQEVRAGSGATPNADSDVRVNYRGTLVDGYEFDSSYARNDPAQFNLGRVIPCWREGVQMMRVGGEATLVCPSEIAYGSTGSGDIPPDSTLIFKVELLTVF